MGAPLPYPTRRWQRAIRLPAAQHLWKKSRKQSESVVGQMTTRQMRKRVEALEKVAPKDDRTFTLEQLCRRLWRQDQRAFLKVVEETGTFSSSFVSQFELESESANAGRNLRTKSELHRRN
jgi:hypothetical protein